MSSRTADWLAWSMFTGSLALTALSLLLLTLNRSQPDSHFFDLWVQGTVIAVTCSMVDVLIASRRPDHSIAKECVVEILTLPRVGWDTEPEEVDRCY
jgi:hypothetical protein